MKKNRKNYIIFLQQQFVKGLISQQEFLDQMKCLIKNPQKKMINYKLNKN